MLGSTAGSVLCPHPPLQDQGRSFLHTGSDRGSAGQSSFCDMSHALANRRDCLSVTCGCISGDITVSHHHTAQRGQLTRSHSKDGRQQMETGGAFTDRLSALILTLCPPASCLFVHKATFCPVNLRLREILIFNHQHPSQQVQTERPGRGGGGVKSVATCSNP